VFNFKDGITLLFLLECSWIFFLHKENFSLKNNSKSQDLVVNAEGLVTKDQSGWGFSVESR